MSVRLPNFSGEPFKTELPYANKIIAMFKFLQKLFKKQAPSSEDSLAKGGLRKLSEEESMSLEESLAQNGLPFDSQEAAEAFFSAERDKDLAAINELAAQFPQLQLNNKAQSLARLEQLYFQAFVDASINMDITKDRMEQLLTQYMRQVFVANDMAEWMVFENDFAEGRYEFGLMYGYGSGTTEHYANNLDKNPDNKERKYLYNKFMMYVPKEREQEVQ
jgi:hypothetical protein